MNKKITVIFTVIIIISFIGCENSSEPEWSSSIYMPLEVGNKWNYGLERDTGITKLSDWLVTDTKTIDNKLYYEVRVISYYTQFTDTSYTYFRQWGSDLYTRRIEDEVDEHIADFSLNEGESFKDGEWIRTVKNKDNSKIRIDNDIPEAFDDEHYTEFEKGKGIVREGSYAWGVIIILTDYELN